MRRGSSGFALVVLGALLWGTGGVTGAVLGEEAGLPPVLVASLRLLVAGLVLTALGAVSARRRRQGPAALAAAWPRVVLVGLLAAAYQATYFVAVGAAGVAVATFLALGAAPVLVAGAVVVGSRRRPPTAVLGAVAVALVGLMLLLGVGSGRSGGVTATGVAAGLLAAASFAALTLVNRRPWPPLGPITTTGLAFLLGGAVLLPAGAAGAPPPGTWSGATWGLVVLLGTVPTAAAYAAYFAGLRRVDATRASVVALLEPATAAVLAAVVLGQVPAPAVVAGGVLLVVATLLVRPPLAARVPGAPDGPRPGTGAAGAAPTAGPSSPTMGHGPR